MKEIIFLFNKFEDNKKIGYSLKYYATDGGKNWEYNSPEDTKEILFINPIEVNEKVVVALETAKNSMMTRKALHETLQTFDIALVPLKTRIYGSVPSKIFEYTALGFPALYFGGGEGETIVEENQLGWVAAVGNFEVLNEKLVAIAQLNKADLALMKTRVFNKALLAFDLDNQLKDLIEKGVF